VQSPTLITATLTANSGAVAGPQAVVVNTGGYSVTLTLPLSVKVGTY